MKQEAFNNLDESGKVNPGRVFLRTTLDVYNNNNPRGRDKDIPRRVVLLLIRIRC